MHAGGRLSFSFLLLVSTVSLVTATTYGQGSRGGTITGTVFDQSGRVVPDADVTVINQATGDTRRTVSSETGFFSVVALLPATYQVEIEKPGFVRWRRTDIRLEFASRLNLTEIVLEAGGGAEEITVSSSSGGELAPADSGERSATLTAEQIEEIPLLSRTATELLRVLPGMAPHGGPLTGQPVFRGEVFGINTSGHAGFQSPVGRYSANGTQGDQMHIMLDGEDVTDPGCNCGSPVNPNPEMISEFKVLTSNYGAEHAKGPVVIDTVSRSGARDFHGSGYFHFRHWKLNANEWELNRLGQERVNHRFSFPGFTLGGPLTPGRDKLFFFVGMEWMSQTLDTGILRVVVPTEGMRQGDFSESEVSDLYSPPDSGGFNTVPRIPCLGWGNEIPEDCGEYYPGGIIPPEHFDPGGRILLSLPPLPNADPAQARGYNYVQPIEIDQPNTQQLVRVDYSLSDDTKLFVRYNRQRETQPFITALWSYWANVPYPSRVTGNNRSDALGSSLTHVFSPTTTNETLFSLTFIDFNNTLDDPSKVSRSALGYPYQGIYKNEVDQIPSVESYAGAWVENPYFPDGQLLAKKWLFSAAENLTKVVGSHTLKLGGFYEWLQNVQSSYNGAQGRLGAQTWHPLSTGNEYADLLMGRIDHFMQASLGYEATTAYQIADFYFEDSWKVTPRLTLDMGLRLSHLGAWYDRDGYGMAIFDEDRYDPDVTLERNQEVLTGIVWHARDPTVSISGRKSRPLYWMPRVGAAVDLSGNGNTVLRGGLGVYRLHPTYNGTGATLGIPRGERVVDQWSPMLLTGVEQMQPEDQRFSLSTLDGSDNRDARTLSYSVTLQLRLPDRHLLEMGYVGNSQNDLFSYKADGGRNWDNVNAVPPGAMLEDPDGMWDNYRPFPLYGNVFRNRHHLRSNYNAFQTTLSRTSGRLSYLVSYTFSKTLGHEDCGAQLADLCYRPLSFDRTHLFSAVYSLHLPEYQGEQSWLRGLLNGWQLTGISNLVSGANLQSSISLGGDAGGTDLTNVKWLGTPDLSLHPSILCDPRKGLEENQIANPACFGVPPERGVNGDYVFPYIKGPYYHNHDLSIFKNIEVGEGKKLQLRFSGYNFLNHPLERLEGENLDLRFEGGVQTNDRFGRYDDDPRKEGRRLIQIGVRFIF